MNVNYIFDSESMNLILNRIQNAANTKYRASLWALFASGMAIYALYHKIKTQESTIDKLMGQIKDRDELISDLSSKLDEVTDSANDFKTE